MKRITKKNGAALLLVLLVGGIYFVFSHTSFSKNGVLSSKSDFEKVEESGELVVVTDYSPIGYYIKGDTVAGFNYDLLQIFQEYTDLKINIVLESSLEKSIAGLTSGKYDVVARSIPVTSDLKNRILFSETITQNKQILVQRKQEFNDSIPPLRSHLDLANKTLHVPKNSPVILRINNLSHEIGDTIHYVEDEVYGAEQLAIMVAQKEIDFAVCDEKTARKLAQSEPELDFETMLGFTQFEAWAVSKDSPVLMDTLNAWIAKAAQTKKYKQIYQLYYD